jgi:PncC family amidohydrolase
MDRNFIKKTHKELLKSKKTISIAESCTGGMLSSLLTSQPGASDYFISGVVSYRNEAKVKLLGIPARTIKQYGAISEQTARLMAENIRKITKSDFGLSTTGVAGPKKEENKPVGTVFICLSKKDGEICRLFSFKGSRLKIQQQACIEALNLLCAHLSP